MLPRLQQIPFSVDNTQVFGYCDSEMNANMNITISNVKNAIDLDQYLPVEGEWSLHCDSDDRSEEGIAQSVRNWMDAAYATDVTIYHLDGRAIQGDVPDRGTFLAIRR